MYRRIFLFVCFFWMTKTGDAADAGNTPFRVYLWGLNPFKRSFRYNITFLTTYDDMDAEIRYIDYHNSKSYAATYKIRLVKNNRLMHSLVSLPKLVDYEFFSLEVEAPKPFDYIALMYSGDVFLDTVKSVPQPFWSKKYDLVLKKSGHFSMALLFSVMNISVTITHYMSHGTYVDFHLAPLDYKRESVALIKNTPYLHQTYYTRNSMTTQIESFSAPMEIGMLLLAGRNKEEYYSADSIYVYPEATKYTFYGRRIRNSEGEYMFDYYVLITSGKDVIPPLTVVFTNGTKKEIDTPEMGDMYKFPNITKLEGPFEFLVYACNFEQFEFFQPEFYHQYKSAHVLLNPLHEQILEVMITVTGTKEALDNLKMNGKPLALSYIRVVYQEDDMYSGEAKITAQPVQISSTKNISIFVNAVNRRKNYFEYSSHGPSATLLDATHFNISEKEPEPQRKSETEPVAVAAPGYNEFKIVCRPDLYGVGCAKHCLCDKKCRIDGTCATTPCRMGTFGDGCKHEDLAIHATDVSPRELFDGDITTGAVLADVKASVTLNKPTPLNSFTFVFDKGADLSQITEDKMDIYIRVEKTQRMVPLTEDYSMVISKDNHVTVHWVKPRVVQKMEVAVATKLKATSFHLDGGQQADSAVADNRTTHKGVPRSPFFTLLVGGSNPMPEMAKNLTDGDRFSTCVNTEEARDLTLTFATLTLLERIMIYTPGSSEWKAEVMCYDVCETLVMTTALSSGVSRVYQVNVNTNVKKVHIKILSGTLNMCELQAYADPEGPLEDQIMASQAPDAQSSGAFMLLLTTLLVASCVVCSGMFLLRKRSNETLDNAEE